MVGIFGDNMNNHLFVSFPRSGHHLVERMLRDLLKDQLVYSEFYNDPILSTTNLVKTHLFRGDEAKLGDAAGWPYLLAMRDPYPALCAWWMMNARYFNVRTPWRKHLREGTRLWLRMHGMRAGAAFWWTYEDLCKNPRRILQDASRTLSGTEAPSDAISRVLAHYSPAEPHMVRAAPGVWVPERTRKFRYYTRTDAIWFSRFAENPSLDLWRKKFS